jgi:hypothetical protein
LQMMTMMTVAIVRQLSVFYVVCFDECLTHV